MSNMKREWEALSEEEQERMMRQAGLTSETLERINKWIENASKESDDKSE